MSLVSQQPKLRSYGVGQPAPFDLQEDGATVLLAPDGITVCLNIGNPSPSEVLALKAKHQARMGMINHGRLGFFVMDFGGILKFDAPFDAGIQHPDSIFDLELPTQNSRFGVTFIGVNSVTKAVFGIRHTTLSPRVSRQVAQLIRSQIAKPISPIENAAMVANAYRKYTTTKEMIRHSRAFDLLGSDDSTFQRSKQGPFF